jgi:AAA family ATP:ADP antiporter
LFTVVSRSAKYKAKSVIETVVYRGGDAVSGWIFAALSILGIGFSGVAAVFVPIAAIWTALAVRLGVTQDKRAQQGLAGETPTGYSDHLGDSLSLAPHASEKGGFK